jgi:hypothetical protein
MRGLPGALLGGAPEDMESPDGTSLAPLLPLDTDQMTRALAEHVRLLRTMRPGT